MRTQADQWLPTHMNKETNPSSETQFRWDLTCKCLLRQALAKQRCYRQWANRRSFFGRAEALVKGLAQRRGVRHHHQDYGNRPLHRTCLIRYAPKKPEVPSGVLEPAVRENRPAHDIA